MAIGPRVSVGAGSFLSLACIEGVAWWFPTVRTTFPPAHGHAETCSYSRRGESATARCASTWNCCAVLLLSSLYSSPQYWKGVAKVALDCACPTRGVCDRALHEQGGHLAASFPFPSHSCFCFFRPSYNASVTSWLSDCFLSSWQRSEKDQAGMRIQGSEGKRASKSFLELAPGEEAKLLASMAEAERRETTSAADILQQIRRS